jgi:hypothetical protein
MLNKNNITNRNFEQEERRKQSLITGLGFYLPGLLEIFTLFPSTGTGLIIIGTFLILKLFFLSPSKDPFDIVLLLCFFGLLFGLLLDFSALFHTVFYLDFSHL